MNYCSFDKGIASTLTKIQGMNSYHFYTTSLIASHKNWKSRISPYLDNGLQLCE